jgi:TetR/AcrR family transcriptional regulator, mexJK operon transcriptional repressor
MDNDQHSRHRPAVSNAPAATKTRRGPGRTTPSETKKRNVELLDNALDLFLKNGFERTTIDQITASIGMAKRTVYLRYGDKTKLFKTALQRAIEEWIVPVERLRAEETEDLEESLLRIGQILVENIMSPAGLRLMRITNAESGRLPEIGIYAYKQGTDRTIAYLAELFRRRIKQVDAQAIDPHEAALGFLYLVVGGPASVTAWGLVLEKTEIDKHTRDCVRLFLRGLLPRNQAAESSPTKALPQHAAMSDQLLSVQQGTSNEIGVAAAQKLETLENENRRLKMLLAESMLEMAALKDSKQ